MQRQRLEVIGHSIAIGRIAIPSLQGQQRPHLLADELPGKSNTGIKALHVADLECTARVGHGPVQFLALLHACAQRLFHKDVFARRQRLQAERDVELIGRGDDDRFHLRVREHVGKVGVGFLRLVNGRHALDQVRRLVAQRVQARIAGLNARLKVGELGNGAAAQHADGQESDYPCSRALCGQNSVRFDLDDQMRL